MSVAVVFTGGTIASRVDAAAGGAVPALRGAEILERVPELAQIAQIEPIDWGLLPASHFRFAQLIEIAGLVDAALARPEVSGAVVVQGTDSIEETCFAYDLLVRSDKPVVVTGAMRNAGEPDYDGPRNLADAVRLATTSEAAGLGTLVVLNGVVLGAEQAVKAHASAIDAFQARDGQPLGSITDSRVDLHSQRRRRSLPAVPPSAAEPIHLITVTMGMDGELLRRAGVPRGVVVAATGAGNTPSDVLDAARDLLTQGVPVVLTTRAAGGSAAPAYAFPGGGAEWSRAGALISPLDGPKCRVGLALGLGAGLDRAGLERILWATPSS